MAKHLVTLQLLGDVEGELHAYFVFLRLLDNAQVIYLLTIGKYEYQLTYYDLTGQSNPVKLNQSYG